MGDNETIDRVVQRFLQAKSRSTEAMARGTLVVDENVQALGHALRAMNIRIIVPRSGMSDEQIKTELLPNRIIVTRNSKDFVYDASANDFGIISLDKLKYIDPATNNNTTAQMISRAIIDHGLWSKRHGFILILESDGDRYQALTD